MKQIFFPDSPYKKQARSIAMLWTLLIFVGCLYPGRELPHVQVPLIDKWTHFVLFGVFAFLWLCACPAYTRKSLLLLFLIATGMGVFIELLQGLITFLGRSMELMDVVADSVGGMLGIAVFLLCARMIGSK
jgi:VanZ family protein